MIINFLFGMGAAAMIGVLIYRKMKEKKGSTKKKIVRKEVVKNRLTHYDDYQLSQSEFLKYALISGTFFFILGYLFYQNIILSLLFAGIGQFYPKYQRKKLLEKRKVELEIQFKEAIFSLSSSLSAGHSIENAFKEVEQDLKLLYPSNDTLIIREVKMINKRIENGETIERTIADFAKRSQVEDIMNFSNVFSTCKRTGGDLVEVIRRTSDIISEKQEIKQEISVMISQKRFESNILTIMPLGMVFLLKYTSGGYLDPLYSWKGMGPIIMTCCLGMMGLAFWISRKIMNIKV